MPLGIAKAIRQLDKVAKSTLRLISVKLAPNKPEA